MAFQRVPNTAEIDVIYIQNGETMQNTFYARFGGTYALANIVSLAVAVDVYIAATWLFFQTLNAAYVRVEVRGLNAANDWTASANAGAGPGQEAAEGLPNQVTLAFKKFSGLSGRSARGRTYWMGMPKTMLTSDENIVDTPYVIAVEAAIDGLRGAITGVFNWDPVLVSRYANKVLRTEGVTFDWAGTTCVNEVVDTQRGRLPS